MVDNSPSNDVSDSDLEALKFSEVASGIYRRFDPTSVWMALRHAVGNELFNQNPTIMLMFVRIAEVYPAALELLREQQPAATGALRKAIDLTIDPPQEIRDAKYLPDSIQSPGEMDLCWGEFLVTGKTEVVQKIVSVLDRDDQTRTFLEQQLADQSTEFQLSESAHSELQQVGIGIGKRSAELPWEVMTQGDTDLFLWLGIKDKNSSCVKVFDAMDDDLKIHLANKGAALWSLQANASQHGVIRMLCEEAAKAPGGFGRKLLNP